MDFVQMSNKNALFFLFAPLPHSFRSQNMVKIHEVSINYVFKMIMRDIGVDLARVEYHGTVLVGVGSGYRKKR